MNQFLFALDQRDPDNAYSIAGGVTHCFEFQLGNWGVSMDIQHSQGAGQDFSLRGYFSDRPFGPNLFQYDDLDSFSLPRMPRQVVLQVGRMKPDETPLAAGVNYYFHVQNLQGSINRYSLFIEQLA